MRVPHDLDFDVARPRQILLDVHLAGSERGECFLFGERERLRKLVRVGGDAHAFAPAARGRFDDDGKSELSRHLLAVFERCDRSGRTGDRGNPLRLGERAGRRLVPHLADLIGARSDERDVGGADLFGEFGIFGQEAVAGMDRVGAGDLRCGDQARDVEIAVAAGGAADADVVVGEAHVQRLAVRFGIHRHRLDAQLLARADHPQGDLPAVGDEHPLEHQGVSSIPAGAVPPSLLPCESTPDTLSANSLGFVA